MIATAGRQPGWKILRRIPFLGPVRVAQILAIMRTPFRFRTKRNLWAYAGLAVVTRSSADEGHLVLQILLKPQPEDPVVLRWHRLDFGTLPGVLSPPCAPASNDAERHEGC